jgi:hypothetical protein
MATPATGQAWPPPGLGHLLGRQAWRGRCPTGSRRRRTPCSHANPAGELRRIGCGRAYLEGLSALPAGRITCSSIVGIGAAGCLRRARRCSAGDRAAWGRNGPEPSRRRRRPAGLVIVFHHGSVSVFDGHGFAQTRCLGRHHGVVTGLSAECHAEPRMPPGARRTPTRTATAANRHTRTCESPNVYV